MSHTTSVGCSAKKLILYIIKGYWVKVVFYRKNPEFSHSGRVSNLALFLILTFQQSKIIIIVH